MMRVGVLIRIGPRMYDFRLRWLRRCCGGGAEFVCRRRCSNVGGVRRLVPILRLSWTELLIVWYLETRPSSQSRNDTTIIAEWTRSISLLGRLAVRLLLLLLYLWLLLWL